MNRVYLNDGWKFSFDYNSLETISVRIPHTVKETPFNYFSEDEYQTVSRYEKSFVAPNEWIGNRILLTFDGVAHYAEVFLNEKKVGEHSGGYTAFTIDISEKLIYGKENLIKVKVDSRENLNIPPFGHVIDYMTYGGIYRDVYIDVKHSVYISDVFAKPKANGEITTEITILGDVSSDMKVVQSIASGGATHQIACVEAKNLLTTKDVIKNAVNKTKERLAVPDFKLDKDVALERENYPYYLTVYNKGAVYEPAEGGYYVEVQFPNYSQGYDTYEEAKAELDEFISTDDENWHEVGKDAYEWEGRYVGDGQYVRLETNKNYLKAVVEYNGYESFKGHKFKSKKRPNKLRESKSPDLVWRIRNNALNYDDEREAHHGSDNKGYHVDIQDRLSNTTEFSGVKDKNGNIVGMGRKLNHQPKKKASQEI